MVISRIHEYYTCSGGAVDARPRVRQVPVGAEGRARHLRRRLGLARVEHVCREPGPQSMRVCACIRLVALVQHCSPGHMPTTPRHAPGVEPSGLRRHAHRVRIQYQSHASIYEYTRTRRRASKLSSARSSCRSCPRRTSSDSSRAARAPRCTMMMVVIMVMILIMMIFIMMMTQVGRQGRQGAQS